MIDSFLPYFSAKPDLLRKYSSTKNSAYFLAGTPHLVSSIILNTQSNFIKTKIIHNTEGMFRDLIQHV